MTLPTFLGIGAQRSGTTWLDRLLRTHPAVYLPERRKEVHYFDWHYARGPEWYEAFFPADSGGYVAIGEITPRYLFDPAAAERILRDLPEARLLAILRNPAERAFSQYRLDLRNHNLDLSFEEYLTSHPECVERGFYHRQISRFLSRIERGQLLVLVFERAVADLRGTASELGAFLGVDPEGFRIGGEREPVNAAYRPRFGRAYTIARGVGRGLRRLDQDWIVNLAKRLRFRKVFGRSKNSVEVPPESLDALLELYRQDMERLRRDLGVDVSVWTGSNQQEAAQ